MKKVDYYKKEKHPWGTKPTHFILQNVNLLKKGTVLDLGGGDGKNSLFLANKGFSVVNVDANKKALNTFEELAEKSKLNVKTIHSKLEDFEFKKTYDNIITTWTLHYLKKESGLQLIKEMKENTKKEGVNLVVAYTKNGGFFQEKPENFFLEPNELLTIYGDWDILRYEKMMGGSKPGYAQEREMVIARNI